MTSELRQLIEQAQQAQPDTLKPDLGHAIVETAAIAADARAAERAAMGTLAHAVRLACDAGLSQREAARLAGVTRQTIRAWTGGEREAQ